MRRTPTPAEVVLWRALRAGSLLGWKIRRQVPVGPFILDFAILSASVAIEVDGESHAEPTYDARRTSWLEARDWRVLRFTNSEVLSNRDGVLMTIASALGAKSASVVSRP